ncbi:uncharacterized protein BDZ99DRAFT_561029 [Mytilinidion resinicola]|uniref:Zinc finger RING-type eukaryotic domain-containing protein n=1 Tax=Mytilinidion resinicola TaxID=574789 RepID=A0A6A6YQ96_9PEZI|nr:uncharacterized protein BDZ99DRAFT_561029 [Mytilinidion resinicola]KAF2810698.1 hypothetical protein BDZ99DRAFT_561029 [Mytilinidion resinicola]
MSFRGPVEDCSEFIENCLTNIKGSTSALPDHCPICHDPFSASHPAVQVTNIPNCNHIFGRDYLVNWLSGNNRNSNTCPLYHTTLYGVSLQLIYEALRRIQRRLDDYSSGIRPARSEEKLARAAQQARDELRQQADLIVAKHRRTGGTLPVTPARFEELVSELRHQDEKRARQYTEDLDRAYRNLEREAGELRRYIDEVDEARQREE